jgi:NADPH:quinone reductase-like Zn-dependent oxidoreductase
MLRFGGRITVLNPPIPEERSSKFKFLATAIAGMGGGSIRALLTGKRLLMTTVKPRGGDLEKIGALIEAGKIRPVVERVFNLDQIAETHRLSETGHVRGKLVVKIS